MSRLLEWNIVSQVRISALCTDKFWIVNNMWKGGHYFGVKWPHKLAKYPNFLRCHASKVCRRLKEGRKVLNLTPFSVLPNCTHSEAASLRSGHVAKKVQLCLPFSTEWTHSMVSAPNPTKNLLPKSGQEKGVRVKYRVVSYTTTQAVNMRKVFTHRV